MKRNALSIISWAVETLVLVAPTLGYAIYIYADTLQQTMSQSSKGSFWALISIAILLICLKSVLKGKYDQYVQGYIQQKTDLETNPTNELLIKRVEQKKLIVENLSYVVALFPLICVLVVLYAFYTAIGQLMIIIGIMCGSLIAKIGANMAFTSIEKTEMLAKIKYKDGE